MTVVKIKELEKFIKGAILDEDIFFAMGKAQMQGCEYIDIPANRLADMKRRQNEQQAREKALSHAVWLNNKGLEYEKAGKLRVAIYCYEQNIILGSHPTYHPYKRLMVLYRQQKDYENEING